MPDATQSFASFDGQTIAYRTIGRGRPTLMLHGFLADAERNYILPGIAAAIVAAGRQAILPDFRGHGASAKPVDPAAYPHDVLALDQEAFLRHIGIADYDLVGYSMGARTAVRMLARGARPGKCVLGGMGDSGVTHVAQRQAYFEDLIRNGEASASPAAASIVTAIMEQGQMPRAVALLALASQISTPVSELARIDTPILVISGTDDSDNGSAEALAALLPNARAARTPGNHLTAISAPELAQAIVAFLENN
ncbi:MAG: alpha/beta fold hydrolase [Alphaproteobacteria bacterium]|nr:alpha/beta fold hydrolase [Alphaproteobacteria bacterium]